MSLIKICSIPECGKEYLAKGYCKKHYQRLWTKGSVDLHPRYGKGETPEQRFWSKTNVTANPEKCWEWQSTVQNSGYGQAFYKGKAYLAHRLAWLVFYGVEPNPNLFILHSCDNKKCVNPNHLREGTREENTQDAIDRNRNARHWAKQSHCKNGHEYTEFNTSIRNQQNRKIRVCLICDRARQKKYRQNRKLEVSL